MEAPACRNTRKSSCAAACSGSTVNLNTSFVSSTDAHSSTCVRLCQHREGWISSTWPGFFTVSSCLEKQLLKIRSKLKLPVEEQKRKVTLLSALLSSKCSWLFSKYQATRIRVWKLMWTAESFTKYLSRSFRHIVTYTNLRIWSLLTHFFSFFFALICVVRPLLFNWPHSIYLFFGRPCVYQLYIILNQSTFSECGVCRFFYGQPLKYRFLNVGFCYGAGGLDPHMSPSSLEIVYM